MNKRIITLKKYGAYARFHIEDLKELAVFARELLKQLKGGDVLALSGELGSGKTAFTKELAKAFCIQKIVTSPTFVLMNVYAFSKKYHGALRLCHIDAYRLKSAKELEVLGAEEYIGDSATITVIEWPERVKGSFSKDALRMNFKIPKK
ncbi:tRNA (adenosine(37)-N6)-threonylcarbamoyltransferase complex ATPase subunit type 1 TsaE [Candidatus Uhrbacteria bacterium]|nr:tRNA (adenosine(37)-N6)-threonylcarbamoyltransferase complex ATPase subunit type 1 TsaE [Candidatus Uhrbacteria bacterium]